jgi:glycosyltransferase involved in cell wall biosynthesis/peptidoglycan/xylan/chitin deacetylase (PgdA/CDA1 family)
MKPLTVMFLIDVFSTMGGAERNLCLLANGLREKGHRVIICCLKGGELSEKMRSEGFHVENLRVTRIYDLRGLSALFKLVKIARGEEVAAIISYHESSDYLGLLAAALARVPIISSRRDMGFSLKPRHIWLYRLTNGLFDLIVAVSSAVKEQIVKTQGAKPSDFVVVYNGVNVSPNGDEPLKVESGIEFEDESLNVCCLANVRPIKGQKDLVEAARLVANEFPSVRFFLVGNHDIEKQYYADLQRRLTELGLDQVVKFTGELPPSQVVRLLGSMDISVLSSLSEGMSNALLESMAAEKPVVATAVGGNPELVQHGKTGYLVPPSDPDSMAAALLKLLTEPELRREMGANGRARVESEFSVAGMVARYEDLLHYVCLKRRSRIRLSLRRRFQKSIYRLKSWARVSIAAISYYFGLVAAFDWIKRALHRGRVKILCFHDISEMRESQPRFSISLPPKSFSKFLEFLRQHYEIVSLEKATRLLESGKPGAEDVFSLTFDDCYKGWIEHVLPECQRNQVPYTIFLTTGPLDSAMPLFYDALIYLAENTWRKAVDGSPWQLPLYTLNDSDDRYRFVEEIHDHWLERSPKDRNDFLLWLSNYLEIPLNSAKVRSTLLNWKDVRKIDASGVTIGAHSVNHY